MYSLLVFIIVSLSACSRAEPELPKALEVETILLCDGAVQSIIAGESRQEHLSITLTKVDNKVIKAKILDATYTLKKIDTRTPQDKEPIYRQLVIEPERIILRTEVPDVNNVGETVIENSGRYKADRWLGWSEGTCKATAKVF